MKPVPNSERRAVPGFEPVAAGDPNQVIDISIRLRRRRAIAESRLASLSAAQLDQRQYLSRSDLQNAHGAQLEDVAKIVAFANDNGWAVVDSNLATRIVKLRGTSATFQKAFNVALKIFKHKDGRSYRGRTGEIYVPDELGNVVQGVHGLDNRDQARPHFRILTSKRAIEHATTLTPTEVASAYGFPANATGKGQTIGLIELGGGYTPVDLQNYFQQLGTNPQISSVSIDGAANQPIGDPNSLDTEVMLDIEVAGTIAPAANIVVYFAPNTEQGFLDAVASAIHDQTNNPSVVSISWGAPEASWSPQAMESLNQDCQDAALLGIAVLASTGDQGSSDGAPDGSLNVDFPSSSPYVMACGGTTLALDDNGAIASETAWGSSPNSGATGGGQSVQFAIPDYQVGKILPQFTGRGTPDVAGDADPQTCYNIVVDGTQGVVGGTSAVAPLYAGLVAELNEILGVRSGFLNPLFYANPAIFNDVTQGTNGAFQAGPGWDATTGWGSIQGVSLLNTIMSQPSPVQAPGNLSGTISLNISGLVISATITGSISGSMSRVRSRN